METLKNYMDTLAVSLNNIDWVLEGKLWLTAIVLGLVISGSLASLTGTLRSNGQSITQLWPIRDIISWVDNHIMPQRPPPRRYVSYTPAQPPAPPDHTSEHAPRIKISLAGIHIFGYPSDQGDLAKVIALEDACAADFDYLGLDRINPAVIRFSDQMKEDSFCLKLLQLGAGRWPTLDRFNMVIDGLEGDECAMESVAYDEATKASAAEKQWTAVAWQVDGGVTVSEIPRYFPDDDSYDVNLEQDEMLKHRARLRLATTMDEKAKIIKDHFGGVLYSDIREWVEVERHL